MQRNNSQIDFGLLEGDSAAYFCFDKNLYIWGFPSQQALDNSHRVSHRDLAPSKFQFDEMVTSISLATSINGLDSKDHDKILIVATLTEIRILYYSRNHRDNKVELTDTGFSVTTDQNVVSKIIQFKKNGRIFYGGSTGHVNELKL